MEKIGYFKTKKLGFLRIWYMVLCATCAMTQGFFTIILIDYYIPEGSFLLNVNVFGMSYPVERLNELHPRLVKQQCFGEIDDEKDVFRIKFGCGCVLLLLFSSAYAEQFEKFPLIYSSQKIWDDTIFSRTALVTQTAISAAVTLLSFIVMKD